MNEIPSLKIEEIKTNITILYDTLKQKKQGLEQILNITENQEMILKINDDTINIKELFIDMNREKQLLIDEILSLDNFFQHTYEKYGDLISQSTKVFVNEITLLQKEIQAVMDLDIKIRVQEQNNKQLLPQSQKNKPTVTKNYMIKQYEKYRKNNSN